MYKCEWLNYFSLLNCRNIGTNKTEITVEQLTLRVCCDKITHKQDGNYGTTTHFTLEVRCAEISRELIGLMSWVTNTDTELKLFIQIFLPLILMTTSSFSPFFLFHIFLVFSFVSLFFHLFHLIFLQYKLQTLHTLDTKYFNIALFD